MTIYLDYNASTPIAPEVAEVMRPLLEQAYGNPSTTHWAGLAARKVIDDAREQVAAFLGAHPTEIVFTSGGSESNNTAIKGAAFARGVAASALVTAAGEHPATMESCRFLERLGARLTVVGVDGSGRVDPEEIGRALESDTALVTVMHANNETGTVQPIAKIAEHTKRRRALFHCDAAQSAGKIPVDVDALGVDLLSLAGHKLYAPKGVGALFVRRGVSLVPLIHGGGQELGRRAGTESALLAAALGEACRLARAAVEERGRIERLRDRLFEGLVRALGVERVVLNGHPTERLPNTLNVSFVGAIGAEVLGRLEGVAASTGSACHTGGAPSPVLAAMGVADEVARGAVRFSVGRGTTELEIQELIRALV